MFRPKLPFPAIPGGNPGPVGLVAADLGSQTRRRIGVHEPAGQAVTSILGFFGTTR